MAGLDIAIILAFIAYSVSSGFRNKDEVSKGREEYFPAAGLALCPVWYRPGFALEKQL